MIAEPYKIKEIKKISKLLPYERWNIIKDSNFNTFHILSDYVAFDLIVRGMSPWSHFQKAGYMIGDEAYAGSENYLHLTYEVKKLLGIERIVPTHNIKGSEKLLTTTLIKDGNYILTNRKQPSGLIAAESGIEINLSPDEATFFDTPDKFGGNIDTDRLQSFIKKNSANRIAYIYLVTSPYCLNSHPFSLRNISHVSKIAREYNILLALDISNIFENAYWIERKESAGKTLGEIVREIIQFADIILMDGSQDARSDVGGFITSRDEELYYKLMNQVVVFEGLHTYGGMTGRAMEVFARGIAELSAESYIHWYQSQLNYLYEILKNKNIPIILGTKSISLIVQSFLPHIPFSNYPKFVLAAALYIQGGLRGRIDGEWSFHSVNDGKFFLSLELPGNAYTVNHLNEIADVIARVYSYRDEISGLTLTNNPEFVDEATFAPEKGRVLVSLPRIQEREEIDYEPYKIAIFEPVKLKDREKRIEAIKVAGFNTFLLNSDDVYIDLLTDSGTSAMSCYQWEGMTNSSDSPYMNKHFLSFVSAFKEILGYNYIIPTHQGRAAEHIMSQTMIKKGQIVPGNMYFTTTKLHQEMAGGVFVDVIVDEAHDPESRFPWKGNIDINKLKTEIERVGEKNVAYISFEACVNMAGGQPFSMANLKELSRLCQHHGIPIMFDATRCVENAYLIKKKDPDYANIPVRNILKEIFSLGDGCTISCKKDFLVNMGGLLACNDSKLFINFQRMLRIWEGEITNGGMDPKDIEALHRGLIDSIDDEYIRMRVEQTQRFGKLLIGAGIPIVEPPGSHAIFIDAKRFLPHIDQDEFPAQALSAAIYIETGVRTMERGNVSKGRDPETGKNYRPKLELVRCTIPRRVYTNSHIDFVVDGIKRLYDKRDGIKGLKFTYEPKLLRFFQSKFEPLVGWNI